MDRNGSRRTWLPMGFRQVSIGSNVFGRILDCAASRNENSRLQRIHNMRCRLRKTCWSRSLRPSRLRIWLTDITYIPTCEGWLYLAAHKDLFSGEVVGYAMAERMTKNLVSQSLFRAVASKRPPKGLIVHSDRGSQYCSREHRRLIAQFGMVASMSGKGNCYDNAPMESFWGMLKNELVHHRRYVTRQEAIRDITEYIEIFYNRQRRQARLNYLSPSAFVKSFYEKQAAA